jgi:hypothetical protein
MSTVDQRNIALSYRRNEGAQRPRAFQGAAYNQRLAKTACRNMRGPRLSRGQKRTGYDELRSASHLTQHGKQALTAGTAISLERVKGIEPSS